MDKLESSLNRCLKDRIDKAELNWSDLSKQAIEIVVFGSRAVGMNRRASDLDVLVVGKGARRMKRRGLDLICISTVDLALPSWLDSELAGHISKYGVWLKGVGDWRDKARVGKEAAKQKERRLVSLVRSVKHSWSQLHPAFQFKYCLSIRRELQRLLLLRTAIPIPPTPVLDAEWRVGKFGRHALLQVSNSIVDDPEDSLLKTILA
jgi:predicted nucleotidyltransferase